MLRAFIYVRISKDRAGAGLGVERQEGDCRQLAKNLEASLGKRIVILEIFVDNDMSAYYSGKPRWDYIVMLEELRRGSADLVLSWHTDRLHRSPRELEEYIEVSELRRLPTHCWKAGVLDLTTSHGRMQARISGAVNRQEVEHMSERICAQRLQAVNQGLYTGGPVPYGYVKPIRDEDGNIVNRREIGVRVVEAEAAVIREAADRVVAGESLHSICQDFTRRGVPTRRGGGKWSQVTLKTMLVNPRYAGFVVHRGQVVEGVEGVWKPILTEDQHHALRAILCSTEHPPAYRDSRSLVWLGTGLYRCGSCGAPMRSSGSSSIGAGGIRLGNYRCRDSGHLAVRARPIDAIVNGHVCLLLAKKGTGLIATPDSDTAGLRNDANTLQARLVELEDMLGEGELSRAAFARQRDKITTKLDGVQSELATRANNSVLLGVADAPNPAEVFLEAPMERRRAIVDVLFDVTLLPGKRGRRPKGMDDQFEDRVRIEPKAA